MVWATVSLCTIALSLVATGVTTLRLRRDWNLHVSSVRWLFVAFFGYFCAYYTSRLAYLVYVRSSPEQAVDSSTDGVGEDSVDAVYQRYSTMGIFTVLNFRSTSDPYVTALLCLGDTLLFAVAVWMFPLAFELANLATKSMDRGPEKEKRQIRAYSGGVHALIGAYAALETVLSAVYGGYTTATQRCLLSIYFIQFFSFFYMLWLILRLRIGGRKYENVRGQFVTSPIYQRLTRIMAVYVLFSLQYQLVSVVMYAVPDKEGTLISFISVSSVIYSLTGLALAVTTLCSQVCVLQACHLCIPDDIEAQMQAQLMQAGGELATPRDTLAHELVEPPMVNPVFVFTDIESSSALWGIGDGTMMQRATELHDNILRSLLTKYRGYEITTAGDAFQLAFHTVREAVEYCLDVQLQLLVANWPKELHHALPATRKHRAGHRLIFNGLRVRMGIHDAVEADGPLVVDVHAVTGKMTYTGAAEVIANEVGDLGDGGQILITKRVAEWLFMYADLLSIESVVELVGEYAIPQINAKLEVFQVLPEVLAGRRKQFSATLRKRTAGTASFGTHGSFSAAAGAGPARERVNSVAFMRRLAQQQEYQQQRPLARHASQHSVFGRPSLQYYERATSM